MYNEDDKFTRLTLEQSDKKIVWEVPYEDVDGVDDMMQAIYTIMVGMTFLPNTIYWSMASYLEQHASSMFKIIEKDSNNEQE